jgi:hypothetical protein
MSELKTLCRNAAYRLTVQFASADLVGDEVEMNL